jgi:hypothetical protein
MLESIVAFAVVAGMVVIAVYGVHALFRAINNSIGDRRAEKKGITTVTPEAEKFKVIAEERWDVFKNSFTASLKSRILICFKFIGIGGLLSVIAASIFVLLEAPHLFGFFFFSSSVIFAGLVIAASGTAISAVLGMFFSRNKSRKSVSQLRNTAA